METNCKAIVSLLEQLFLICVTPELLQQDWIFLQTPFSQQMKQYNIMPFQFSNIKISQRT